MSNNTHAKITQDPYPIYQLQDQYCFDAAMKHMENIGKLCCNGDRATEFKYDEDWNYLIINETTFQFWTNPKTYTRASYELKPFSDIFEIGMHSIYKVGDRLKFTEERQSYTIQAINERYAVCTKPFNCQKTVLYTILDFKEGIRGPNDLVFNMYEYEKQDGCQEYLNDLMLPERHPDYRMHQISYRHRCKLSIEKHTPSKVEIMKSGIKTTQETKVVKLAGKLWNEFLKVEGVDVNDTRVVNENIHRIQDMMQSKLFNNIHGKL
jgi:hypothetical protein